MLRQRRSALLMSVLGVFPVALLFAGCGGGGGGGGNAGTPPLSIVNVTPDIGRVAGGTSVTITLNGTLGTNPTVTFGGVGATVVGSTATTVTVTTPAQTVGGVVDITVTQNGPGTPSATLFNGYTYENMVITNILPATGDIAGGTAVTITGRGFVDVTGVQPLASFEVLSPTLISGITAVSSAGMAGQANVIVTSTSQGVATLANGFSYTDATNPGGGMNQGMVGISALNPTSGPTAGGTMVTITGVGFTSNLNPVDSVTFGGVAAGSLVVVNDTTLTVSTPAAAAAGPVDVTVSITTSGISDTLLSGFTYFAPGQPPVVTSITPAVGPEAGGTFVTITGSNFLNADTAAIGSALLNFQVVSDTTITGTTAPLSSSLGTPPVGSAFNVPVVVTSNAFGDSNTNIMFGYELSLFIERIEPNDGPISGGTTITITGRNLLGAGGPNVSSVQFGGVAGTGLTVTSATQLIVTTPAVPLDPMMGNLVRDGAVDVTLVGQNGFDNITRQRAFIYGVLLDDASVVNNDPFDIAGDRFGPGSGNALDASLANIGSTMGISSRVASADYTQNPLQQIVAVTLPLSNQLYVYDGLEIDQFGNCIVLIQRIDNSRTTHNLAAVPTDVVGTDLDADGLPDFVCSLNNGQVQAVLGNGGVQTAVGPAGNAVSVSTCDFNGDGRFDIVSVRAGDMLDLYLNNGAGVLNAPISFSLTAAPFNLPATSAPIRIVAAEPSGVSLLNLSNERDTATILSLPARLKNDVNRDGNADVIVLTNTGQIAVAFGDGVNTFTSGQTLGSTNPLSSPVDMTALDFNLDNRLDLAVLTDSNIAVFRSSINQATGLGSISQIGTLALPQGANSISPNAITTVDIDLDCLDDLVMGNADSGGPNVAVYLSNGDSSFAAPRLYTANVSAFQNSQSVIRGLAGNRRHGVWVAADFGVSTAADSRKGLIELDRGLEPDFRGEPTLQLAGPLSLAVDPRAVRIDDLDDDGAADLVAANFGSNTISVRLGNGDGSFQTETVFTTEFGPESLVLGDVDGDGDTDVVVANNLLGTQLFDTITVHLNSGSGTLGFGTSFSIGARSPREVRLADVDRDGDLDAVTVNQLSNSVSVLLNNGSGAFGAPSLFGVGNSPFAVSVADMGTPEAPPLGVNSSQAATGGSPTTLTAAPAGGFITRGIQVGMRVANRTTGQFFTVTNVAAGTLTVSPAPAGGANAFSAADLYEFGAAVALRPDGFPDLVVTNSGDDNFTILYNNQGGVPGTFGAAEDYALGGGVPDVIASFDNIGMGTGPITIFPADVEPRGLVVVDMNLDGALDVVTADQGANRISLCHANSRNLLIDPATYYDSLNGVSIGAGDAVSIHADLQAELKISTTLPRTLSGVSSPLNVRKYFLPTDYRHVNGGITEIGVPSVVHQAGSVPQFLATTDLNVDGRPDLIVASFADGTITTLINAGDDIQGGQKVGGDVSDQNFVVATTDSPGYFTRNPILGATLAPNDSTLALDAMVFGNNGLVVDTTTGLGETFFRSPAQFCDPGNATAPIPGYSQDNASATRFTVSVGSPITGIDVGRVNDDCPPDVAVTLANGTVLVLRTD